MRMAIPRNRPGSGWSPRRLVLPGRRMPSATRGSSTQQQANSRPDDEAFAASDPASWALSWTSEQAADQPAWSLRSTVLMSSGSDGYQFSDRHRMDGRRCDHRRA